MASADGAATEDVVVVTACFEPTVEEAELGPSPSVPPETVLDEEIKKCQLTLVRHKALDERGAVRCSCEFKPAERARFTSAILTVSIKAPSGTVFELVIPEGLDAGTVHVEKKRSWSFGLAKILHGDVGGEETVSHEETRYSVKGYGCDRGEAVWRFAESPEKRDGVDGRFEIRFRPYGSGEFRLGIKVAAKVARRGFQRRAADSVRQALGIERRAHVASPPDFIVNIPPPSTLFEYLLSNLPKVV
mmetsp:Transcript_14249/g.43149  ORF Transcript_14249/g.43149 Transcript_14249/m.43149 type:complete len:246 (+) Transcript_14249:63-800(+)|eukprot:CAMPEP_0198662108 /NCGR_PEP_ID=MMETSP1467-20131203/45795_1 /TAXON_ID=1462469 /ORGANISM="unid. sp., Strain CCMP2135" /LENGTH=245 /DNA_ID=CAMNT_0044398581 /DNA_START=28 /DNA_END=765 /DNA_ORIENTATION=+